MPLAAPTPDATPPRPAASAHLRQPPNDLCALASTVTRFAVGLRDIASTLAVSRSLAHELPGPVPDAATELLAAAARALEAEAANLLRTARTLDATAWAYRANDARIAAALVPR